MIARLVHIRARGLGAIVVAAGLWSLPAGPATAHDPHENAAAGDGRVSAFYDWRGALPDEPGRILRTEPLPATLGLSHAGRQLRILYTSTDGVRGHGIVPVSGALFLPKGKPPAGGWPIIAWAHGTVGVADICAPSWAGRSYRDVRYLNTWLDQGYAVVASDYQGLGVPGPHPYLQTRPEAYSVLDAIRAALRLDHRLANKAVVVGQSQGGEATVATAGFAPSYAPDIHLVGAVATGAPYFDPKAMAAAPAKPAAKAADPSMGYLLYAVLMAQQNRPSLAADQILTPLALPVLDEARIRCVFEMEADATDTGLDRSNSFQPGGLGKVFGPVFKLIRYPTVKLRMPLFLGTGESDRDVPPELQRALARDACNAGSVVEFHSYAGQDHAGTVNTSLADSLPFVRKVFAGEKITPECPGS